MTSMYDLLDRYISRQYDVSPEDACVRGWLMDTSDDRPILLRLATLYEDRVRRR